MKFLAYLFVAILLAGLGTCQQAHAAVNGLTYTTYNETAGATPLRSTTAYQAVTTGTTSQPYIPASSGNVFGARNVMVMVHFTGYLYIPGSGSQTITFYDQSDDGFSLALNGSYVINNWAEQGCNCSNLSWNGGYNGVGSVTVNRGQYYAVDIWWYQNQGGLGLDLYWDTGSGVTAVPASVFYQSSGPTVTGTSAGTVTTTSTSGSVTSTYSQPVTITYYSDGSQTTANNGAATLISTTDTGGSSTITSTQQQMINAVAARMPGLGDNSIYINQTGTGDTINITQLGRGNRIDGATNTANGPGYTTAAPVTGGGNHITVRQQSNNNLIDLAAVGGNNTLNLNQGTDSNGNSTGLDTGGHYQFDYVNGSGNNLTVVQENTTTGAGQFSSVAIVGNLNTVGITQSGMARNQLFATVSGNSNNITTTQTGTSASYININSSGNGNSAVVNQSNTGAAGVNTAAITLVNAGAPASVNLTQTGGQNYSVTQTCATACGTVTVRQGN